MFVLYFGGLNPSKEGPLHLIQRFVWWVLCTFYLPSKTAPQIYQWGVPTIHTKARPGSSHKRSYNPLRNWPFNDPYLLRNWSVITPYKWSCDPIVRTGRQGPTLQVTPLITLPLSHPTDINPPRRTLPEDRGNHSGWSMVMHFKSPPVSAT